MRLAQRIRKKMIKLRLRPISVFVFHSVSDEYNPLLWWKCDWTQTEQFKQIILSLKEQYVFIPLYEAFEKIKHDKFRFQKYAVLTADDGYRSLLNILPWLEEQKIPITLFVNTKYLDKHSWSTNNEEQARRTKSDVDMLTEVCLDLYMSKEELFNLNSTWISVGMHGHEHLDATKQFEKDFRENVERCKSLLLSHPRYIPYYAYTWGRHNNVTDRILREKDLIPVLVNGMKNFDKVEFVNRICIDGKTM